ncbi:MAG: nodulation protein NodJ, partial [Gammaproteobacteria bacterium]
LVHAVELVRPLMAGRPLPPAAPPLAVLGAYALATWALAVALLRRRLLR